MRKRLEDRVKELKDRIKSDIDLAIEKAGSVCSLGKLIDTKACTIQAWTKGVEPTQFSLIKIDDYLDWIERKEQNELHKKST